MLMGTIKAGAAATLVLLVLAAPSAYADWREPFQSPAPINADATRNAAASSLAGVGGSPVLAWAEDTTQPGAGNASAIHVARLTADGTAWRRLPGSEVNPISRVATASSYDPSVADVGGAPWVAWTENHDGPTDSQIRVARPASPGQGWVRVADSDRPINARRDGASIADFPTIADAGGRPYVAFEELDPGNGSIQRPGYDPGKIWVMRLSADASHWEVVGGGPANADPTLDSARPRLTVINGRPWVTYFQVAFVDSAPVLQVRVTRLNDAGTGWTQLPPVAQGGFEDFEPPVIAGVGGVPMVALAQRRRVRVLRPDATGWSAVGGGPVTDVDADSPGLADLGGVPWALYRQGGQARVARFADGAWIESGGPITGPRNGGIGTPHLAAAGGLPWVAYSSSDGTVAGTTTQPGCCDQLRVARLVPDWGESTSYSAATTAALLLSVDTFGLKYPLGIEYGPDGGARQEATLTAPNAQNLVLHPLRGLSPFSRYTYRPFATAGTPTRSFGPSGTFVTTPAEPPLPAPPALAPTRVDPGRLVLAILESPARVRRGRAVRLRMLSTDAGTARLTVRRGDRVLTRVMRSVPGGRFTMTWRPRFPATGRLRLTVTLTTADGRVATDTQTVRVVKAR
jgi:hypothetical protein